MFEKGDGKVILATFAGRRDRMEILTWYARAAIERGIIDEWHVWDFTRQESDARWLRQQFPSVRLTPSAGVEYFSAQQSLRLGGETIRYQLSVAASNDVIVGLRRISGIGDSYEIGLGGWANSRSVIRAFPDASQLTDLQRRPPDEVTARFWATPRLLPEYGFTKVAIDVGPNGMRVSVGDVPTIDYDAKIEPGVFDVLYRSGSGCNAEWRFTDTPSRGSYLFLSGEPGKNSFQGHLPRHLSFYQHYGRHLPSYASDVFLKCDDDIVFMDLERLQDFITFRRDNPQYFLVSANVVNNGVCAYFQQQNGQIPQSLIELELPPNGSFGTLWASSQKAEIVHRHFLRNTDCFRQRIPERIDWNDHFSINFIALLGADFVYISDIMFDDELYLCYNARWRSRKSTVIYCPFVVSHLSFFSQDKDLELDSLLEGYSELAQRIGVRPAPEASSRPMAASSYFKEAEALEHFGMRDPAERPPLSVAASEEPAVRVAGMVEAALAIADIMQRVWAFRRGDGSTIAEPLRFGHGGRLIGHSHPNEAAWRLHDGCLEFLDRGGAVTTRFDKVVQNADGICVLAGAFNGRGYEGVVHVLHELSYRRQPGPGESQTGAPAA